MCRCVGVGGRVSAWVGWVRGVVVILFFPSFLVGAWVRGSWGRKSTFGRFSPSLVRKNMFLGTKTYENHVLGAPKGLAGPARNLSPILAYSLTWQIWQGRLGRPKGLLVSFSCCGREFLLSVSFGGCVGAWVCGCVGGCLGE